MSKEITIVNQLILANGNLNEASAPNASAAPAKIQADQATPTADGHVVTLLAGTDTAITLAAAVATVGWSHFTNLDATNYVQWGPDNSGAINPIGRMLPGESAQFRMEPGSTMRMKAHSGPCNVRILVLNT